MAGTLKLSTFQGEKVFYLIRPTEDNLVKYERWMAAKDQSEIFLGDEVDACFRLVLQAGQTLFIPTGWIHAVLTTTDSIVFGGNFLHSFNIGLQLRWTIHLLPEHSDPRA